MFTFADTIRRTSLEHKSSATVKKPLLKAAVPEEFLSDISFYLELTGSSNTDAQVQCLKRCTPKYQALLSKFLYRKSKEDFC